METRVSRTNKCLPSTLFELVLSLSFWIECVWWWKRMIFIASLKRQFGNIYNYNWVKFADLFDYWFETISNEMRAWMKMIWSQGVHNDDFYLLNILKEISIVWTKLSHSHSNENGMLKSGHYFLRRFKFTSKNSNFIDLRIEYQWTWTCDA